MVSPRDYARVYRNNAILTASPGQLVLMMFDGALRSLALARGAFDRPKTDIKRIEVINRELLKAQAIISELKGSLNHSVGGDFPGTMERLYDYYYRRLFEANLRKQVEPIVEVERLLTDIRDAWAEMLRKQDTPASAMPAAVA
jgi:flagellar protein FliS